MSPAANSTVRVRNTGTTDWSDKYAKMEYLLPPGTEGFVPWPAAVLWFGDPGKIDVPGGERHRTKEVARLRTRYGAYQYIGKDENGVSAWDRQVPKVEVFDLDGNPVTMIIHDPKGDSVSPAMQSRQQEHIRDATIKQLQDQVGSLVNQINRMSNQQAAEEQGEMGTDEAPVRPDIPGVGSGSGGGGSVIPPSPSAQSNIPHAPTIPTPGVVPGPTSKDPEPTSPGPQTIDDIPVDTPNRVKVSG